MIDLLTYRLALGTVQFGLPYGIANKHGQVSTEEVGHILEYALAHGVEMLDTARSYGESEKNLGRVGVNSWKIVTKLPKIPEPDNVEDWVVKNVRESLDSLQVQALYGLLLHHPHQLLEESGARLYNVLQDLKKNRLVQKIGISIYDPEELLCLTRAFELDIVQVPLSIMDRRLVNSGWMNRLSQKGIEIHVRSIFLQGLLVMSSAARPPRFSHWNGLWGAYDRWLLENKVTALEACVRHVLSYPAITRIVVGVENLGQLREILGINSKGPLAVPQEIQCEDRSLLHPHLWNTLI